jgi:hypothetical protein
VAWTGLDDRLGVEVVKNCGLEKDLSEVKDSLQKESDEHDTLRVVVGLVYCWRSLSTHLYRQHKSKKEGNKHFYTHIPLLLTCFHLYR